ncbi:FAD dependent oxidoreductase-domain-containing protein [Desarmillaria tabescens]|uniref:FAD dependent oxidoreductase-domain-containing protein n=1 Tax=Armillaria tabescens TaxID=1929756 RepID=A0AA39JP86_ARMTA|nr:FAD dependent oxidoreductase-domain-containing protein [Desarmillaria tabescens]KAK0444954.1 FAD dependent oxidoreductase-domain-containing protein [Desarmillaria tabescens]
MSQDPSQNPPFPFERPCLSIWQRTTRHNPLLHEGASSPIPSTADAVVIGSGMAGAVTAYELLSAPNGPKNIVMLEAREACSGATGRNAGHCRPDAFRGFAAFSKIHGPEQAIKIIEHEKLVLQLVKRFIDTHKIECDFDYCKTFDVIMGEDFFRYVTSSFESFKQFGGDTAGVTWLEQDEARKATRVPEALGAFEWNAASLHPAKLCLAVLAIGRDLIIPTPSFSSTTQVGWNASLGHQSGIPGLSEATRAELACKNDRVFNEEIQEDAVRSFKKIFPDFGEEALGEGLEYGWTGILGMTKDSVPFVGAVPGCPGQYVLAGFNGHGMARIFGCAPGLAQMVLGGNWEDTGMPECFQITEERMAKLRQ